MKRVAVIGAILEEPKDTQEVFNKTVADFRGIIKGRMGIPLEEENISVISITVVGELDEINNLTGKLGRLTGVNIKTTVSKNKI